MRLQQHNEELLIRIQAMRPFLKDIRIWYAENERFKNQIRRKFLSVGIPVDIFNHHIMGFLVENDIHTRGKPSALPYLQIVDEAIVEWRFEAVFGRTNEALINPLQTSFDYIERYALTFSIPYILGYGFFLVDAWKRGPNITGMLSFACFGSSLYLATLSTDNLMQLSSISNNKSWLKHEPALLFSGILGLAAAVPAYNMYTARNSYTNNYFRKLDFMGNSFLLFAVCSSIYSLTSVAYLIADSKNLIRNRTRPRQRLQ